MLDDLGVEEGSVQLKTMVQHVRAHRSLKAISALGADQKRAALGNRVVDKLAKAGAVEAPGFGQGSTIAKTTEQVKWAIRHIAWWHNHSTLSPHGSNGRDCWEQLPSVHRGGSSTGSHTS